MKYIVLSEKEETDLIDSINNTLVGKDVSQFYIIKQGKRSGLWRRVKKTLNLSSHYYYLDFKGNNSSFLTTFALCVRCDLHELVAVHFSHCGIHRMIKFPKVDSEWDFLWNGYKKVVQEYYNTRLLFNCVKKTFGDVSYTIFTYLYPTWSYKVLQKK